MLSLESELNILFELQTVNRKVQGVPQSQTAANPWHQEEEKNDKKKQHAQNKPKMQEKHIDQLSPPQARHIGLFCYF